MADYLKHDCDCETFSSTKNIVHFVRYFFIKVFSDNKKPLT